MLSTYTTPSPTRLILSEAALAMRSALSQVLGQDPAAPVLALALAKTALETGRWTSMWNWNWGNIKASDKHPGSFTCITLNEVLVRDGKRITVWFAPEGELSRKGGTIVGQVYDVPDGHPQTRMRAYENAAEGALDYCRFVSGSKWAAAWERLLAGDANGYVHELKAKGYFTADEETYKRSVVSLQREFIGKLSGMPHPEADVTVPPVDVVRAWLSPMDIAELEAELADRYFDLLAENRAAGHREMSGLDEPEPFPLDNEGKA